MSVAWPQGRDRKNSNHCPACKAENDATADACFTCGRALSALTQGVDHRRAATRS